MRNLTEWIPKYLPDVYVAVCEVGRYKSVFYSIPRQLQMVRACVQQNPLLADGFVGLGHSQGGLLLRRYAELFNGFPSFQMKRLVTLSCPHGGFYCGGLVKCPPLASNF